MSIGDVGVMDISQIAGMEGITCISKENNYTEVFYFEVRRALKKIPRVDGYTEYSRLWDNEQLPLSDVGDVI